MKKAENFEFLEHTADIKFRAYGEDLNEVFKNSALATLSAIYSGKKKVKRSDEKKVKIKGKDLKELMYNFLDEVIYLIDAENFLIGEIDKFEIKEKAGFELNCEFVGDDVKNYDEVDHIKSVTYSEMIIEKRETGGWISQVVLDI